MDLKFGLYSDAGTHTCGWNFGSLGYEDIDAQAYASWGVDYLKYDNCYNEGNSGTPQASYKRFAAMSHALNRTGRPMVYSMCNWGEDGPWNWGATIANSWRISGDIIDNFKRFDERCPCTSMLDCKLPGYYCSITRIIDFAAPLSSKGGVGHWNDLDMLEVGRNRLTYDQEVTHFSMWAIIKSPLILGHDVRHTPAQTLEIISNDAIIALNQDAWGASPVRIWKREVEGDGDLSLWYLVLSIWPTSAVAVLNTSDKPYNVTLQFADIFVDSPYLRGLTYHFIDLWQKDKHGNWGKNIGIFSGSVPVSVGPHQTRVFKTVPVSTTDVRNDLHDADLFRVQKALRLRR